ncbi:MAG: aminomethyl-transferring glycine dehydrogenase [Candidatus Marinimicrobia bacterium]|jgi:glycine dehydrogenase|nr:aminomethyl-transferring glycine dehydrogenase [Candidatus Neomarinimicrobiota bacterium]MBT3502589.1 aminomethyl-transferring glycine dehydrogenase [Candidatus Neomarinimicrobiota bacterium]MBT3839243.1 aminomethyl-transferring glycine dehydrogenase [Candidatus Neomarinimicrobiota bacterium]MBT3999204.1 aminomethyl-transferring glycine dehydrogenase [Candidatus Neomarinimicrobiota bacterium]MBT4281904.1 aminomethyl-transferring glycine dehydrogenase [Candidatus Neomarinimicrobiota bacterium
MSNSFANRHLGPRDIHIQEMLSILGFSSLDQLSTTIVPENILSKQLPNDPKSLSEPDTIKRLREMANKNLVYRSFIGIGYYGTFIPGVIKRNILENPGWYTAYTPYQAEISQGRLEALLNFQTMVSDLTGLPLANASLLDEGTAAAEAMIMFFNHTRDTKRNTFLISDTCHPQTIEILKTRAEPIGINLIIQNHSSFIFNDSIFGSLIQYPDTNGSINDFTDLCNTAHENKSYVCIATDLLALALLKPPGEMGADVAVGNSQRFGVPMGYGGPHAAFFATNEKFKRKIPGRIIGVSQDAHGNLALRMALQTREQHIRREKATSNICTSQVLLAIMSGMYAVYHGPKGISSISRRVNELTAILVKSLENSGYKLENKFYFDTIRFKADGWREKAKSLEYNIRDFGDGTIGISIDETCTKTHIQKLLSIFNAKIVNECNDSIPLGLIRNSSYLNHPVFHSHRSETEMLRYLHRLETKDLSLNTSMIPLGSCTMKLNATTEMEAITWPEFGHIHPFAPKDQTIGYQKLIHELKQWLTESTGFEDISLMPNSGAQGEYAGLMVIRAFHKDNGNGHRNICLIPASAHGTNPASAVMAGMEVIIVECDKYGNISEDDLKIKVQLHSNRLACMMITYPSTHGVFEHSIKNICNLIHTHGGQIYIDGANLNAMLGLCKPGEFGGDVMHINLHKTFSIPHGGGGPGMGPIVCKKHLSPFLPNHSEIKINGDKAITAVSSAPFGSSSILPISWAYMALMGSDGLKKSTQVAILNANYMANILENHYPILYRGMSGFNAHEFIIDLRELKKESGISEEDVAKRLMDYGYHAPTMSFPVPGTLMIEPTESESKEELDRFCEAMIFIRQEIQNIIDGKIDQNDNPLKNAPHTAFIVTANNWPHSYSRHLAAFPAPWLKEHKYWPTVGRVNNAYGDRNLICSCPPIGDYEK